MKRIIHTEAFKDGINKISFLITVFLLSTIISLGQESEGLTKIKRISLLESTRNDVVKILGAPKYPNSGILHSFPIKEGMINVKYGTGTCQKTTGDGGKYTGKGIFLPEGIVIEVRISFQQGEEADFQKLKINLDKYRKYKESDNPAMHYYNDDLGVEYVFLNSKLHSIGYYLSNKQLKKINCLPG